MRGFDPARDAEMIEALRQCGRELSVDAIVDEIGEARIVLMGEASHGTSEYYTWRARVSRRLIEDKGFKFVAVEGDWPDCYEINRWVKGAGDEPIADVLHEFQRWPTWMWANWEVASFAEWLRSHNRDRHAFERAGFYGLDVYSLWESLDEVVLHLREHHPEEVEAAWKAVSCFQPYHGDGQEYAYMTRFASTTCEDEVIELLERLRSQPVGYDEDDESHFVAEMNAQVVANAEKYYRAMVRADQNSWNLRDTHMVDTLDRLLKRHGPEAKEIVWEHNTHIGDARATDMAGAGMVNVGQLARERYGPENVFILGFASHAGTVVAGSSWGAPMEEMTVPPARPGSWESLMQEAFGGDAFVSLGKGRASEALTSRRGHRAIGVVYHPEREHMGNFVPTDLANRYDALVYLERTQALHPLHMTPHRPGPPDTYPYAV